MLCKSCNTTNARTAKFCINCGLQLDSASDAQVVKSIVKNLNETPIQKLPKKFQFVLTSVVVLCLAVMSYVYFTKDTYREPALTDVKLASHETSSEKSFDTQKPTDKPYRLYRDQLLADSWKPYIRENRITTWNPPYPEVIYCYEDNCSGHFINEQNEKVKEVFYSICWVGRYVDCPGKPNGYEQVDREKVWSKSASDKEWEKLKRVKFD